MNEKILKENKSQKEKIFDFKDNADNSARIILWKYRGGGIAAAGGYQEAGRDADICEKAGYESV